MIWWGIWLRPRTGMSRKDRNRLKDAIRKRLAKEDYTCRLPRIKPRVRYKLRTYTVWHTNQVVWR